jgi:beta-fructofuranosidase
VSDHSAPQHPNGAVDHHRPLYHLRPPRGYLNDPNGPIVVGDVTHLYFQSRPTVDRLVPVEWGHLTSTDFATWRLHRPAMAPVPDGPDRDGCYSGNTILDDGRVRAFYSGYRQTWPYQSILTAVSDDGGYSFGPPVQVVPDPNPDEDVIMFRDPFVWPFEDGWRMAVGAGYGDGRSAIRLYASADLHEWDRLDDLASLPGQEGDGPETGDAWECPQILDLAGHSVAIVGTWSQVRGVNSVLSLIVDEEPTRVSVVDHGTNFYAASALRDSQFGPLMFGWVTEGREQIRWAEAGWAGALSLPRQVWLGADNTVRSAPVPTITGLRVGPPAPANGAHIGAQCEIVVPTAPAHVRLCFSATEHLDVVLEAEANILTVDRTAASTDPAAHGGTATAHDAFDDATGRPAARIFIDGSIVEVFTSAGQVLTTRVYPVTPPPWQIEAPEGSEIWTLAAND